MFFLEDPWTLSPSHRSETHVRSINQAPTKRGSHEEDHRRRQGPEPEDHHRAEGREGEEGDPDPCNRAARVPAHRRLCEGREACESSQGGEVRHRRRSDRPPPTTLDELKETKGGFVAFHFLTGKDKDSIAKDLAAAFKLTEPQAAKIVRRITGRVRLYARVFELVPVKKA
ncbi:MAG: hypothetical protein JNK85_25760 [Verrucomicrobiales bacterium]|nr:hypothetical protein [Verrucomicrobiales bacterium]